MVVTPNTGGMVDKGMEAGEIQEIMAPAPATEIPGDRQDRPHENQVDRRQNRVRPQIRGWCSAAIAAGKAQIRGRFVKIVQRTQLRGQRLVIHLYNS